MAQKKKFERYTSPKGVAIYPRLTTPDTKFKPEGEYATRLRFAPEDIAEQQEKAQALIDAFFAEKVREKPALKKTAKVVLPFKPELDDEGEETGNLIGNFKMKAEVTKKDGTKFTQKPAIFDAAGNPTKANPWSGSVLKARYEMAPYLMESTKEIGVTLRLYAVQVIQLVSGSGGDAASHGFGAEEGGWTDDGEETTSEKTPAAGGGETSGSDDTDF